MQPADFVDQLVADGDRLGEVVEGTDLDASVPSCPEWVVRDLVRHIGGVHRWATTYIRDARSDSIDQDLDELVGGWPVDPDLIGWYRAGHADLVRVLRAAPDDLDCWTFLSAPNPLTMWSRRQAHETAIHRVDAELAAGSSSGFDLDFATDGIDELLTLFITRRGRGPRNPQRRVVELETTDTGQSWWVIFDEQSCTTVREPVGADVKVSGPASDLYQVVWNRLPYESIRLHGDHSAIKAMRQTMHVRWS